MTKEDIPVTKHFQNQEIVFTKLYLIGTNLILPEIRAYMDRDEDHSIVFDFFKIIATTQTAYFCDFHKVLYKSGSTGYKVVIQTFDKRNFLADIDNYEGQWQVTGIELLSDGELINKLVLALTRS